MDMRWRVSEELVLHVEFLCILDVSDMFRTGEEDGREEG
jgi:hypothetical protein